MGCQPVAITVEPGPKIPFVGKSVRDNADSLMGMAIQNSTYSRNRPRRPHPLVWTLATAIAFTLSMMFARLGVLGFGTDSFSHLSEEIPKALFLCVYDVAYMTGLTALGLIAMRLVIHWKWARRAVFAIFVIACIASLASSVANIPVIVMMSRPFTYQWLVYSDFVISNEAWGNIRPSLTPPFLKFVGAEFAAALGLVFVAWFCIRALQKWFTNRELRIAGLAVLACYLWIGNWYTTTNLWPVDKTSNPVVVFGESMIQAMRQPPLLLLDSPFGPDDFQAVGERKVPSVHSLKPPAKPIRNVIFFVLESTGARYLQGFKGDHNVAGSIERYRAQSAYFSNVYALTPATNCSMLSLLCSTYSYPSYESIFALDPAACVNCFAQLMKSQETRTGFFYSADLSYQHAGDFLGNHGFDVLQDWRNRTGPQHLFNSEWATMNLSADGDTVDGLIDWIGKDRHAAVEPFFATLWSAQAHYPYSIRHKLKQFTDDQLLNKYLSAVSETDYDLGRLLDWLKESDLLDTTLVVIVGDHGEAFYQHGKFGHGTALYEENIAIPLALINPQLFHGETYESLGSTADVLPTVAECLGLPDQPMWQGRSLLHDMPDRRLYFVQPYSNLQYAFREGNLKMIFTAWTDEAEVYDLAKDPWEKNNIAAEKPEFVATAKQRLSGWIQYQNNYYAKALANHAAPTIAPTSETVNARTTAPTNGSMSPPTSAPTTAPTQAATVVP